MRMIDVDFGSLRYEELLELRYRVLREPLGLDFLDSHRDNEAGYLHVACVDADDKTLGGLILAPIDGDLVRLMQVAVSEDARGQGIGCKLVKYAEKRAKTSGFTKIKFYAVPSIVEYYESKGYVQEGEPVEEQGLVLFKLVKSL